MSLYTSDSDRHLWRRFILIYLCASFTIGGGLVVGILALDPYDRGHWSAVADVGVPVMGQRLANASRGRNAAFNAAILGNSRIQLVSPERLSELTGHQFVTLATPGTGPREQMTIARWFIHHHAGSLKAMVFGLDLQWCQTEQNTTPNVPFPFWLYSDNTVEYALGMVQWKSFDSVIRKLRLLIGRSKPARPDGYDDYEEGKTWSLTATETILNEAGQQIPNVSQSSASIPAAESLKQLLTEVPQPVPIILVFPPAYINQIPAPDSPASLNLNACKTAFRNLANHRSHTTVLDMLVDNDLSRRRDLFWDAIHYRGAVARQIEINLAHALNGGG